MGRPRKADKYGGHIAAAEDLIADRLPWLVDQMFDLAAGVRVMETDDGPIYRRPPDRAAAEYLLNRIMGKPTERREITGANGEPLFTAARAERVLADPRAVEAACTLDELFAAEDDPRPDAGRVRAPRF